MPFSGATCTSPSACIRVGSHDDVRIFDDPAEVLVRLFAVEHEFEEAAIELVHRHHRLNAFTERLTKHGFGLYANTFDAINDDQERRR